jgi:hypothetical protein
VGVPTVIDLRSIAGTCGGASAEPFMVVPRDIDVLVSHFAKVISSAVNKALNPGLSGEEIERLLF